MVKAIDYYGVPTEIFARAFELYVKNQGFDTSLLAPDERFKGAEYAIFDEDLQDKINTFFQGEFPELAGKIREFQKEQAENQQEVQASEKQIESKEQEKEEGIAVQEELSLDNETEQQDSSPKEANRKSEKQNEMPVEDEGTQKEGSKYAPSSQSETAGSGLPDQENLAHEFADPSFLHFTVTNERTQRIPTNYHAITEHELHGLNGVANELLDTARFYNDTLSSGIVNYIYVEDQQVKTLRVRFGKENFAHLTGLIFEGKSPKELLNDLVKSNGAQKNIFVKNDGTTFEKLGVIGGIKQLANTNAMELNKFDDIGQARRLNFTEAIKVTDENLLLALRNTDLDVFSPVSLLNLDNKNEVSSQYLRVPENEIVAIVAERNAQGLPMMVPLDMNDKYINPSEAFVISNALSNYAYEHREEIQDQEAQVTPTEVIDGLVDEGKITPIIEQQAEEPEPSPVVKEEPEVSAENNNSTKVDQEDEQVVEASATNVEGEETIESNEMPPLGVNQPEQQETVENEQTELVAEEPATQEETQSANKNDSANEGEKQQGKEESRDLRRARKKLERLETALRVTVEELEKQRTQTADQSQNTKRLEKLENDVADINKEIQAQNKRIKKLEREAENQAKGLNKDGKGLEISVQNLPRIEAEIEKANNGESKYAKREITWYRKMVSELKKAKEISEEPLMPGAHVDDGLLNQWSKWPNTYYVKGLRGVALEQTADGEFVVSPRSKIKNGEQQRRVDELLQMQYEINEQITEQNEQSQAESTSDTDNEQVKEEQTARENAEIGAGAVVGYAANEELQNYLVNNLNYAPETVDFFVEQGVLQNGLVQGQPAANQGVVTFGEPKRLVAFESASDMMAYYEIQNARGNLRDVSLVNLNDLSEKELAKVYGTIRKDDPSFAKFTERSTNDVDQFVDHYFIYTGQGEVTLAVRNNDRGLEFYQRLHENYPKLGLDLDMPPKGLGQRSMSWWKYLHELKSNGLSLTQDLPGTRISLVQENRKQEIIDTINGFIEKNNAPEIVNTFAVDGNEKKISPLFKDVETALYKPADSFNENRENSVTQTPSATQETVRQEQVQETDRATTAERTAPTQNKPKVSPVQRRKQNEEVASEIFNNAMEKLTVDYLGDTDKFKQALDYISDNPTESLINAITIKETNPKARKVFRFDELKAIGQKMGFKQGDFIKERDKALSVAKGQQGNIELYKHTTERFVGNKPWRVATKWERQRAMRGELKTYYRTSSKSYKVFTLDQTNLKPELHDSFFPDNKIDFNDEAQVHAVRKGLMNYAMSLEDKINANIEKNNLNRSGKYSDRVSEPIAIRIMDDKKLKPGEPGRYEVKDNLRLIRLNANDSPRDLVRTEFKLLAKASADYGAPQNSKINVGDKVRADFEKKAATDEAMINYVLDKRYGLGDEPLSDREWTKRLKAYTQVEKDIRRHSNRIQNIVSGVSSEVDKSVNGLRMNERVIAPQQNLERGISM